MRMRIGFRALPLSVGVCLAVWMLVGVVAGARAGGPLLLSDPATRTPFAFADFPVPVYTDTGPLGILSRTIADSLVAAGYAQWSSVPTSSFEAAVAGDVGDLGLADVDGTNAGLVIGAFNGGGIHVVYDHDGSILANVFGAPPGVLGISSPEYASADALLESWVVLSGPAIAPTDSTGANFAGVFVHEFGHSINLAHSQTNGAMLFFGDDTGPGPCAPPYAGFPTSDQIETMYPFLDPAPGGTGPFAATVDHRDDVITLSNLYPSSNWPSGRGEIHGVLYAIDGVTELTGINVIARNVLDPFGDAVSAITGDTTQGELGPDGWFTLTGLAPGEGYVLYIDRLVAGGFSTPPGVLNAEEEFWDLNEAGDRVNDPSCNYSVIVLGPNQSLTADIYANAVPPPTASVAPPSLQLSVPEGTYAYTSLTLTNAAPVGADDMIWTTTDRTVFGAAARSRRDRDRLPPRFALARARVDTSVDWASLPPSPQRLPTVEPSSVPRARRVQFRATLGSVLDGGFELGGVWSASSLNFGSPICDLQLCGSGSGSGPRSGARWAWFGGYAGGFEEASISQQVVIPSGGATLTFYLEQSQCDSPADRLEVLVDGNPVFVADGASADCGQTGYTLRTVDLGAYADGAIHSLEFRAQTSSIGGGVTNFFVDDVDIVTNACPWLDVQPQSGFLAPGESEVLDLSVNTEGMVAGDHRCELLVESNAEPNGILVVPIDLNVIGSVVMEVRTAAAEPVSIVVAPDGSGSAFTQAMDWDGVPGSIPGIVDATIEVTLRDLSGAPLAGFPARAIQLVSSSGDLRSCVADTTADADTDATGRTRFQLPRRAGGTTDLEAGEVLQVTLDDVFVADVVYGEPILYGSDRDGALFVVDTVTGNGSFVCSLPSNATEIEYDKTTGAAWVHERDLGFAVRRFSMSDCTQIGVRVPTGTEFNSLEYVGADLFGVSSPSACSNSSLRILDPTTGGVVVIGPTGKGPIVGLAWDRTTSTLYGVTGCSQVAPTELVTINLFTGAASVVGQVGASLGSLQFGPDGVLYAGGDQIDGGNLYRIDPLTGQATLIGATGFASVSGLTLYSARGIDVRFNGPDLVADGVVDLVDVGAFASLYTAPSYSYAVDYTWDGRIDLKDVAQLASRVGASCGPAPASVPLEEPNALVIAFEDDGGRGNTVLPIGQWTQARVVLRGPAAEIGVRAWSARLETSSNVDVAEWTLVDGAVNVGQAPDFVVGHGRGGPRGDEAVLLTMRLRVTDEEPATVSLLPVRDRSSVELVLEGSGPPLPGVRSVTTREARINAAADPDSPPLTFRGYRLRATPNPFNPTTTLRFELPRPAQVGVELYDARGRRMRTLGPSAMGAGAGSLVWDGRDAQGVVVSSGVYVCRLLVDGEAVGTPLKINLVK